MKGIFRGTIILALALVGIGFTHEMIKKRNLVEVEPEEEFVPRKVKRKPASVLKDKTAIRPLDYSVTSSQLDDNRFKQNVNERYEAVADEDQRGSSSGVGYQSIYGRNTTPSRHRRDDFDSSRSSSKGNKSSSTSSSSSSAIAGGVMQPFGAPSDATTPTSTSDSNDDGTVPEDNLSCSSSVGGGAFGNPIQISLSCTTNANIRYCVKEGDCCNPETEGTSYSEPIVIGATDGNFCLSFYGETTTLKASSVVSQSYIINNTYPDLQLSFPKTFYQTTQLAGLHYLHSNDFGKTNFSAGEINLKSHDPGVDGLNMDCQEIVETYVTLPAPSPSVVFSPMDLILLNLGDQLNVPLAKSKLDYGENFITSYVLNNNYAAPLYSCSTTKVTLNDFSYFVPEASFGGPVSDLGYREISGSFVAYGFFEADTEVFRGPAGVSNHATTDQELEVGSFAVFY